MDEWDEKKSCLDMKKNPMHKYIWTYQEQPLREYWIGKKPGYD